MEKKFSQFSVQEAMRLANSDAGKQLIGFLKANHGEKAAIAGKNVEDGDYAQAQKTVQELMSDPQAKALMHMLWEEYYGRNGR